MVHVDADPSTPAVDDFRGSGTGSITIDPNGRFLYVSAAGIVALHQIDSATGALRQVDTDLSRPGIQGLSTSFAPAALTFWSEVR